jgi:hypothetical protein
MLVLFGGYERPSKTMDSGCLSSPSKTKLGKIGKPSMSLRSTTTTNIMLVVFGDVRGCL